MSKLGIHFIISTLYLVFVLTFAFFADWEEFTPSKLGDFIAGVFSPLAFYWFVVTVHLQRLELSETRKQFERQAAAAEQQADIQTQRNRREQVQSDKERLNEAISSIPGRIFRLSKELEKLSLRGNGATGENICSERLETLSSRFLAPPPADDTSQATRDFARKLRRNVEYWNQNYADEFGTIGSCIYVSNEEVGKAVRSHWLGLLRWHMEMVALASQLDDVKFQKNEVDSGLDDLRYAYFQVFQTDEKYLWEAP